LGGVGDGEGREMGGDGVGVEEDETGLGELGVRLCVVVVEAADVVFDGMIKDDLEEAEFGVGLCRAGDGS
jgi:hypothetical protein